MLLVPQSSAEFEEMLSEHEYAIQNIYLYCTAQWCAPCRAIKPHFINICEASDDIIGIQVDLDLCPAVGESYNVSSMPTFIRLSDDQRLVGASVEKLKMFMEV